MARRPNAEIIKQDLVASVLGVKVDPTGCDGARREAGQRKVKADALIQDEAEAAAVFADEGEPTGERVAWCRLGVGEPGKCNLSVNTVAPSAEKMSEQLGATGAHQATAAENFARVEIER